MPKNKNSTASFLTLPVINFTVGQKQRDGGQAVLMQNRILASR